jgi:hypothetical protein
MLQDSLGYQAIAERIVVPLGVVVAVIQMTTTDKHAVGSFGERPEDEFQIDPAGAHQPDHAEIRGVLKARNAAQVGASVATPVAQKSDDGWLDFGRGSHAQFTRFSSLGYRCQLRSIQADCQPASAASIWPNTSSLV